MFGIILGNQQNSEYLMLTVRKQVTCVCKKGILYQPHERIESIGGYHCGRVWRLKEEVAINNIKQGIEEYFILSANNRELNIVVAVYDNKEYLKTETDNDSPDNLLGLPQFFEVAITDYVNRN
jgi:hypothetical protein